MTSAARPRNTGESGMASRMKRGRNSSASTTVSCPRARAASNVHARSLKAWANGLPVGERGHQDDAFTVRESSTGEAADRAIEKILVLIELHDVIARGGISDHWIPGLRLAHAVRLTSRLTVHRLCLRPEH